jgi:BirA family transcriptional regulator, biotin operon repressor / biotin---[acetyl-CoA-carboxylase] ligase
MADEFQPAYMIDPLRFERVARIDSTSSELMRRPFAAVPQPPCALLADVQEAGRGRNGRVWLADPAHALTLSVSVEREVDGTTLLGLPLAVGVAIVDVLGAHGAAARLKWPNDLQVDGADGPAKAGGILVEVRQQGPLQRVVVGFGLNLSPTAGLDAARVGQSAGALFPADGTPARLPLARELAGAVAAAVGAFARDGLRPWLARWRALDALADLPVDLVRGDGSREPGIARGIENDGALRVERLDGTLARIASGEVSVRRRV